MYRRGSTNIDDLLDLDDPSDSSEGFSNRRANSYSNAIRSNSNYMRSSNAIDGANQIRQQRQIENYRNFKQPRYNQSYETNSRPNNYIKERYSSYEPYDKIVKSENQNNSNISCQDVLKHISNCPICSKFYNNDRTVYIIIIIILIIICLLLVKKVLNV
jgi:hypothetical protein